MDEMELAETEMMRSAEEMPGGGVPPAKEGSQFPMIVGMVVVIGFILFAALLGYWMGQQGTVPTPTATPTTTPLGSPSPTPSPVGSPTPSPSPTPTPSPSPTGSPSAAINVDLSY